MAESRKHEKYDALIYSCRALAPVRTAVAHPCDEPSLAAALDAARVKIINRSWSDPKPRFGRSRHPGASILQDCS
jgi:phosphate acetyltransferase